nr:U32 family peptidase [Sedimentibacter sp.]
MKEKKQIELLAPAGSIESFYAAVNSGADAVYLGGKNFNARQNSQNFDNDEMMDIIRYAHNKDVKIYVTLNTVLKDTEILDALNYAVFLYENDVDAVIVQDLGLLYLIKKHIPDLPVNMSTQATVYDEYGVKFYDRYKVNKIIMARELSLGQIREAVKNTNTDLEVFIHGALCACYSGQCYMSSFLGGRSGNRGKCAQPCRLNYNFYDKENSLLVDELDVLPVLSMKDFKAGDTICELIDAGIKTFKIEGRMKGPEYTASVVEYYRNIIDNYLNEQKVNMDELEQKAVSTFSRGYTNGYLKPDPDDEMFAKTSSGVKGDDISDIAEEIKDRTEEFSQHRRKNIDFHIKLKVGEPAVLFASDGMSNVTVKSKELCETSMKNPVTEELINEQLGKLGSTIYKLKNLKIDLEEGVFLRKSTFNQMRRDATEYLYEEGAVFYDRPDIGEISHETIFNFDKTKTKSKPKISLKINCNEEIGLVDKVKVKRVYIPYNLDLDIVRNIDGVEKYLWIPNIVSKSEYNIFKKNISLYEELFDGVCVNNAGTFHFFKQKSKLIIHCGSAFNIINTFAVELLKDKGIDGFTFSVEANIKDMESIMSNMDVRIKSEIITYAYTQLMVMKNCPMSLIKNCKNIEDCEKCSFKDKYALKDRKGIYFNIEREKRLTHIYNSVPLTLIGKTTDFIKSGIEYYLIDTKWEDNVEEIIDAVYCELNGVQSYDVLIENNFTRGHYLRNIL